MAKEPRASQDPTPAPPDSRPGWPCLPYLGSGEESGYRQSQVCQGLEGLRIDSSKPERCEQFHPSYTYSLDRKTANLEHGKPFKRHLVLKHVCHPVSALRCDALGWLLIARWSRAAQGPKVRRPGGFQPGFSEMLQGLGLCRRTAVSPPPARLSVLPVGLQSVISLEIPDLSNSSYLK